MQLEIIGNSLFFLSGCQWLYIVNINYNCTTSACASLTFIIIQRNNVKFFK